MGEYFGLAGGDRPHDQGGDMFDGIGGRATEASYR